MHASRLAGHLVVRYLIVTFIALLALGWFAAQTFDRSLSDSTWTELEAAANLAAAECAPEVAANEPASEAAQRIAQSTRTRVTLIAADGRVLVDTRDEASQMVN